jgi:opacity protein-like surface antigen
MKKIILFVAVGFISLTAFAQDDATTDKPKSFIGVTGGYTNLMGNIIKSDYSNNSSGYANSMGYNTGIDGAYYFSKYVGIGGVFSFASFSAANLQSMSDGYKNDFDVDSVSVTVTTKYNFYNFFVGPYFSIPVKKFTIDLRVLGGLTLMNTPEFDIFIEDGGKPHPCAQNISHGSSFGSQLGAGIRYSITKNIAIKLNADYYLTDPNITIHNSNRVANVGRLVTNYHETITMLNVNLGLAYQFGK